MIQLIGPRNPVHFAQFHARGGWRGHLLIGGAVFLGLGLLMAASASGDQWQRSLSVWVVLLLVIESVAVGLVAMGGINSAVRNDAKSGMHDSMRLMEASPTSIVMGYLTGGSTTAIAIYLPAFVLGLFASFFGTRGSVGGLGFAAASFLIVGCSATALVASLLLGLTSQKAALGSVLIVMAAPFLSAAAMFCPPIALMVLPIMNGGVFGQGHLEGVMILSVAAHASLATALFVACVRKFREPHLPAFRGDLGLVLLGVWTVLSLIAVTLWPSITRVGPSTDARVWELTLGGMMPALLLAMIPVVSAGRSAGEFWRSRSSGAMVTPGFETRWAWAMTWPVSLLLMTQAGAVVVTERTPELMKTLPLCLLAMLAFFFAITRFARYVFARTRYGALLTAGAVGLLMALPPLLDAGQFLASGGRGVLFPLSELSIGGVVFFSLAAAGGNAAREPLLMYVALGTAVQVALALLAVAVLRLPRVDVGGGFEVVARGATPVSALPIGGKSAASSETSSPR